MPLRRPVQARVPSALCSRPVSPPSQDLPELLDHQAEARLSAQVDGVQRWSARGPQGQRAELLVGGEALARRVQALPWGGPFLRVELRGHRVLSPDPLRVALAALPRPLPAPLAFAIALLIAEALRPVHARGQAFLALHAETIGFDPQGVLRLRPALHLPPSAEPRGLEAGAATDCRELGLLLMGLLDAPVAMPLELPRIQGLEQRRAHLVLSGLLRERQRLRLSPARAAVQALRALFSASELDPDQVLAGWLQEQGLGVALRSTELIELSRTRPAPSGPAPIVGVVRSAPSVRVDAPEVQAEIPDEVRDPQPILIEPPSSPAVPLEAIEPEVFHAPVPPQLEVTLSQWMDPLDLDDELPQASEPEPDQEERPTLTAGESAEALEEAEEPEEPEDPAPVEIQPELVQILAEPVDVSEEPEPAEDPRPEPAEDPRPEPAGEAPDEGRPLDVTPGEPAEALVETEDPGPQPVEPEEPQREEPQPEESQPEESQHEEPQHETSEVESANAQVETEEAEAVGPEPVEVVEALTEAEAPGPELVEAEVVEEAQDPGPQHEAPEAPEAPQHEEPEPEPVEPEPVEPEPVEPEEPEPEPEPEEPEPVEPEEPEEPEPVEPEPVEPEEPEALESILERSRSQAGWASDGVIGVTGDSSREAELGQGKWLEQGRTQQELAAQMPDTPTREMDLEGERTPWLKIGALVAVPAVLALLFSLLKPAVTGPETIRITTDPENARVVLDGQDLGQSPVAAAPLPEAGRTVQICVHKGQLDDCRPIDRQQLLSDGGSSYHHDVD